MTILNTFDRLMRCDTAHKAGAAIPGRATKPGALRRIAGRTVLALLSVSSVGGAQDTIRVRSDGPGQWGSDVRLIHELTIGEVDGPPEFAFGRVLWIAAEAGGAFYVFDAQQSQIRRYDTSGRFERLIGRRGGGPGEYEQVMGMEVTSDGLLLVFDRASQRITYFQPDGKLRREFSFLRGKFDARGDFSLLRGNVDARGFVIDTAGRLYVKSRLPGPPEGPTASRQLLRLSREGIVVDSFPIPRDETPVGGTFLLVTSDGDRYSFPAQQTVGAPYALGGAVTARADDYRFVVMTPGRPVLVVQRRQSRVPLGASEREEWLAIASQMPPHLRAPNVRYGIPKLKPVIRDLFSDHMGRVWVEVYVAAEKRTLPPPRPGNTRPRLTWRERTTYDVFAPSGAYLGRLQLPKESRLLDVRDSRLYIRTLGPDGVDQVSVYRIQVANQ